MKNFVKIVEPNEQTAGIAKDTLADIQKLFPSRVVEHVGALAVPMSGRKEIDIMIISPDVLSDSIIMSQTNYSAGPTIDEISYFRQFIDDTEIGVQIVPENHSMIDIHRRIIDKLKNNPELKARYSKFKYSLNDLNSDEYKLKKNIWIKENLLMSDVLISQLDSTKFISDYHSSNIELVEIGSGGHSIVFSYTFENKDLILRFNETDFGFKKDVYAKEHYSKDILIPYILKIGKHKDLYFSISEKINGHSARDEYKQNNLTSFNLQFDAIEKIASIDIPEASQGFGEWYPNTLNTPFSSLSESITSIFESNKDFDWNILENADGFDPSFVKDLKQKITQLIPFSDNVRELRHGDFGNDNVLIENNKIQGIIDWHKASYDDHLFDVSRVVLYCPNRHASSKAALDYYQNLSHENYKERILLGVYFTMLINYGFAAKAGMSKSLKSSPERIKEIEEYFL